MNLTTRFLQVFIHSSSSSTIIWEWRGECLQHLTWMRDTIGISFWDRFQVAFRIVASAFETSIVYLFFEPGEERGEELFLRFWRTEILRILHALDLSIWKYRKYSFERIQSPPNLFDLLPHFENKIIHSSLLEKNSSSSKWTSRNALEPALGSLSIISILEGAASPTLRHNELVYSVILCCSLWSNNIDWGSCKSLVWES